MAEFDLWALEEEVVLLEGEVGPEAMDEEMVHAFYNSNEDQGIEARESSELIHLRKFNNWVKSFLISEYVLPNSGVLDLACGKGQDLQKYKSRAAFYVGIDLAENNITRFVNRYNELRDGRYPVWLGVGNCFVRSIENCLDPDMFFDVVSCQLAFHYAFSSEQSVRTALQNVVCRLRQGGVFICTVPDANVLVKKIRMARSRVISNSICRIEFERMVTGDRVYGEKYQFDLQGHVNAPEYLVHVPSLEKLAGEYGLKLERCENFHKFFEGLRYKHRNIIRALETPFPKDQWDVTYLYQVMVFRKVSKDSGAEQSTPPPGALPNRFASASHCPNLNHEDCFSI